MKETFGQKFLKLRKQYGYTQEDIANKLNVTAQAVSKWENDISSPDISLLADIASMFNTTIDDLLGRESSKTEVVPNEKRKDINSMVLKISIIDDGEKVKINIPLAIIRACLINGTQMPTINGNEALKSINFKEIIKLVEQGVVGELARIESSDRTVIIITVE